MNAQEQPTQRQRQVQEINRDDHGERNEEHDGGSASAVAAKLGTSLDSTLREPDATATQDARYRWSLLIGWTA